MLVFLAPAGRRREPERSFSPDNGSMLFEGCIPQVAGRKCMGSVLVKQTKLLNGFCFPTTSQIFHEFALTKLLL